MSNWAEGLAPGAVLFTGRWFDGESPVGRDARIEVTPAGLQIRSETVVALWPWSDVVQTRGAIRGEPVQFERRGRTETVAINDAGILDAIRALAPDAARGFRAPSRTSMGWRIGLGVVALVAAAFAVHVWVIPLAADALARSIPVEWEEQFGSAVMKSTLPGESPIDDQAILSPLDQLSRRLAAANPSSPYTYRITVADAPEVNAFAGPGGYIVVHRGLLEFVRVPDELAAVLAHEMQHVEQRHVTRGIFQRLALSAVLAVAFGGAESFAGQAAQTLGELSYSRADESAADRQGLRMLEAAGGDGRAMADVLERMEKTVGAAPIASFLSTHPGGAERAQAIRAVASDPKVDAEPLLTQAEWNAMKAALSARASAFPARDEAPRTPSTPR